MPPLLYALAEVQAPMCLAASCTRNSKATSALSAGPWVVSGRSVVALVVVLGAALVVGVLVLV